MRLPITLHVRCHGQHVPTSGTSINSVTLRRIRVTDDCKIVPLQLLEQKMDGQACIIQFDIRHKFDCFFDQSERWLLNLRLPLAQRCRMLWPSLLCHFALHCSPHTSDIREFASCQGSVQVTVCVNIDGIDSAVHIKTFGQEQSCTLHEPQRNRSRRASLSWSNFFPRSQ